MRMIFAALALVCSGFAAQAQYYIPSYEQPAAIEQYYAAEKRHVERAAIRIIVEQRICDLQVNEPARSTILGIQEAPFIEWQAREMVKRMQRNCNEVRRFIDTSVEFRLLLGAAKIINAPEVQQEVQGLNKVIDGAMRDAAEYYRREMPRDGLTPTERMERQNRASVCRMKAEVGLRC